MTALVTQVFQAMAAGAAGSIQSGFVDVQDIFGDIFGDMFGGGGRGGRRSRAQRGADMREDITLEFEEAVFGVTKQAKVRRLEECDQCHGTGAAPGKSPITCTTCNGQGQVRYQQGFFAVARTCSTCQGSGKLIVDPCTQCRGQGRVRRERTVTVKVPAGVEDGQRMLYSGEGEAGALADPRAICMSCCTAKSTSSLSARAKTFTAWYRCL